MLSKSDTLERFVFRLLKGIFLDFDVDSKID